MQWSQVTDIDRYQPCKILDLNDHCWGMLSIMTVHSCRNGLGLATSPTWADKKTKEAVSKAPDKSTNNHQTQTSCLTQTLDACNVSSWFLASSVRQMHGWKNEQVVMFWNDKIAIWRNKFLIQFSRFTIYLWSYKRVGTTLLGEIGRKMTGKLKRSKRSETVWKQTDSTGI
jgi:hypothetical protein